MMQHNCNNDEQSASDSENFNENRSIQQSPHIISCPKCSYKTNSRGNMERHMGIHVDASGEEVAFRKQLRDVHQMKVPLQCEFCSFSSPSRGDMERHMGIHANAEEEDVEVAFRKSFRDPDTDNSIQCDKCSFSTLSSSEYRRHCSIHPDSSGEKVAFKKHFR